MRRLVKVSFIFILIVCGILIAGTVLLNFINLDPYRERIGDIATKAIGRQLEIRGHIDINLFPHPELILEDVRLANAKWGTEPTMVSVGHADAVISFLSLFSDTIMVRRLGLNDVTVLLEQNDQQIGNWVMGTPESSTDAEEETDRDSDMIVDLPLMVDIVEFSNITATVRSPESTDQVYQVSSLHMQPDESDDLILKSSGELVGLPMELDGKITSQESVMAHDEVAFDFKASLGDGHLKGRVTTSRLATLADLQGNITITIKDIQKTLQKAKIDAPLTGPLTADATVNIDGNVYKATAETRVEGMTITADGTVTAEQLELNSTLTPLKRAAELFDLQGISADPLTVKAKVTRSAADEFKINQFQANVGKNNLTAKGRVKLAGESNLSLTLASPDLSALLNALPTLDLDAKASVRYSAEKIAVSEMAITFDKSDINGDFTLLKGDKHNITANITSTLLDLSPFDESPEADTEAAAAPPETKPEPENRYVFKEAPLQLEPLQGIEADVKLAVKQFLYGKAELKDVLIDAAVHNGDVGAKFKAIGANQGQAAAKIDLKTQGKKATIDTVLSLSDVRLKILTTEGLSLSEVPPLSVSLELQTAGSSPRELASVANGRLLLTQGPGKINNTIMRKFSSDIVDQLLSALNPFAKDEEVTHWDCTIASVDIVDGLANIDGMLAQGEKVMIVGGGDIDFKTEALNVEFQTKPRTGFGITADMFVTPFIKLKGTLASPGIGLNKKGTLFTGGAAIATGGLSVLIETAYNRTTAHGDNCEETMGAVGDHINFSF